MFKGPSVYRSRKFTSTVTSSGIGCPFFLPGLNVHFCTHFVEAQPEAPRQVDVFSFAIDIHCEAQEDRTRILRFSGLFRIHRIELTPDFSGRSAHEIRACRTARKLYTLNFGWLSRRFV